MMDETEKYKQRLEAIAEKRRLQEEEDKARREMEDEKLRLQQLKRKSLRDQWLMEGAPLSPKSPDAQSPRSPLWGSQAQEMEEHIDKLESESQCLPEEEEKLEEQMEDGQTEAVKVAEAGPEMIEDAALRNGDYNVIGLETAERKENNDQSSLLDNTSAVLTNGRGDLEATANDSVSDGENQPNTNGHVGESEDVSNMEMNLSLGDAASVDIKDEEEEESTLVMRAERVIITDEGDDVPEDLAPHEDPQKTAESEETPVNVEPDAAQEGGEALEENEAEVIRAVQEPSEQTEASAETQPHAEDGAAQQDVGTHDLDLKGEGQDSQSEDPISVQLQCPADTLEGTTVAPVPVYSEVQVFALTQQPDAEGETQELTEAAEAALPVQDPAFRPDQFQEVPLADPQESQRTEAGPEERDPLLSQSKSPETRAEISAVNSADSSHTNVPTRAAQGEETPSPKRKTCQCCSVM